MRSTEWLGREVRIWYPGYERQSERESERERPSSIHWFTPPDGSSTWNWARPTPGVGDFIWVSLIWVAGTQLLGLSCTAYSFTLAELQVGHLELESVLM